MKHGLAVCAAALTLLTSCATSVDDLSFDGVSVKDIKNSIEVAQALIPISDENEVILGKGVAEKVIARYGLVNNPKMTGYINLLGATIAQRSARPEIAYHFAILDTDEINAYSCPGGFIFITRGVINTMNDEAELGAVLAHEIAHVTERHIVKALQRSQIMAAGAKLTDDAFSHGGPLFDKMVDAATGSLFEGLDKDDEFSADAIAVGSIHRVGYDYFAMFDVLNLLKEQREKGKVQEMSKTHPSPAAREKHLAEAVQDIGLQEATGIRLKSRFEKYKGASERNTPR